LSYLATAKSSYNLFPVFESLKFYRIGPKIISQPKFFKRQPYKSVTVKPVIKNQNLSETQRERKKNEMASMKRYIENGL